MNAAPQFFYQMPINTNDKEMIPHQDVEGAQKGKLLATSRSNWSL
jgi:hypothetical protein